MFFVLPAFSVMKRINLLLNQVWSVRNVNSEGETMPM